MSGGPIKGLTVELGGETKGLQAALKDVGRVSADINKELGQIEKGLKFDPKNTVLLEQKQELLRKKIAETEKSLDALRQAEERVEAMYKSGEIDAGQYRDFRRQIETTESKLKTFKKQVEDVEQAQKDAGKTAGEWGKKLKSGAEKAALGAGAAAGAAFTAGFLGAMDVEKSTDKLAAQLGASAEDAELYGEVAANLYAGAWGDSMEDVTGAVGAVVTSIGGMRDASSADLENMTAKILDFSSAFEVDVPRAAQVAGQMVRAGLVDNATEALDLLTRSMQKVPANVRDDIIDAVDEYAPFLASIGIDGPQAFGLLVKGAERGMYGIDKTGDALKEFTIRATDMSKASGAAYATLGLDQETMSYKLLKGGEEGAKAFDQIIAKLLAIKDPVKQSQAALALFGTPLEDLSVQEIPAFLKGLDEAKGALGDVDGAVSEMGQTLNDNAATNLEAFKRQVQQVNDALPAMKDVFAFLSQYSGIIVPLVGALGGFAVAIAAISAGMKAWAIIQTVLNATMWASPITWIIAAVIVLAGLAYLIYKNWEPISAFFENLWGTVMSVIAAALAWILDAFNGLPGPVKTALAPLIAIITGPFRAGYVGVKAIIDIVKAIVRGDFGAIPGIIKGALGSLASIMKSPFTAGYDLVKGVITRIPGMITSALGSLGSLLYSAGADVMSGLLRGITSKLGGVLSKVRSIGTSIKNAVTGALGIHSPSTVMAEVGKNIMLGLEQGMELRMPAIERLLRGVTTSIPGQVQMSLAGAASAGAATGLGAPSYTFTGEMHFHGVQDVPAFMKALEREVALQGRARGVR